MIFVAELQSALAGKNPFIWIETFGNKCITISSIVNKKKVTVMIGKIFKTTSLSKVHLDLCLSISVGLSNVTLLALNFFKTAAILPNFSQLLSNCVLNLHKSTISTATGNAFHRTNLNFYLAFKCAVEFKNAKNYPFPISSLLLTSNLFCHRIFTNLTKTFHKYSSIKSSFSSRPKSYPCRLEFRCKFSKVEKVVAKMNVILKKTQCPIAEVISSLASYRRILMHLLAWKEGMMAISKIYTPSYF